MNSGKTEVISISSFFMYVRTKLNIIGFNYLRLYNQIIDYFKCNIVKVSIIYHYLFGGKVLTGLTFSNVGGLAIHIHEIARRSTFKPSILPLPSVLNRILNWNKGSLFFNYLDKYQSRLKFRIFHSHVDPWFISICRNAHSNGAKWVHTYHTLYFEKDWDNGLEPWQQETNKALIEVAKLADIRISVSKWLKQHLAERYGIDTIYIPNGVNVEKCDKSDPNRFLLKSSFRDFILFASGIEEIKNPLDYVKLANALPDYQFVMIGPGLSTDALISKYEISIPDNLFISGHMAHEELLDVLAACRVFVITSKSEGLPTLLMEAMALQRTVVGCDTYGTNEVIGSDEFGYIYDHTSLDDLVQKTRLAWNDTKKGVRARQKILENYDWKVVIPQIDKVYSDLINA